MSLRDTIIANSPLGERVVAEFDEKYHPATISGDICDKCGAHVGRYAPHVGWHEDVSLANYLMLRWIETHNALHMGSMAPSARVFLFGLGGEPQ